MSEIGIISEAKAAVFDSEGSQKANKGCSTWVTDLGLDVKYVTEKWKILYDDAEIIRLDDAGKRLVWINSVESFVAELTERFESILPEDLRCLGWVQVSWNRQSTSNKISSVHIYYDDNFPSMTADQVLSLAKRYPTIFQNGFNYNHRWEAIRGLRELGTMYPYYDGQICVIYNEYVLDNYILRYDPKQALGIIERAKGRKSKAFIPMNIVSDLIATAHCVYLDVLRGQGLLPLTFPARIDHRVGSSNKQKYEYVISILNALYKMDKREFVRCIQQYKDKFQPHLAAMLKSRSKPKRELGHLLQKGFRSRLRKGTTKNV